MKSKLVRLVAVTLSVLFLLALSDAQLAFGQRFRGGVANQNGKEGKKQKENDDEQGKRSRRTQGNQGQGSDAGANANNQNPSQNTPSNKQDASRQNPSNANQGQNQTSDSGATQNSNKGRRGNRGDGQTESGADSSNQGTAKAPIERQPFLQGRRGQGEADRDDEDGGVRDSRGRDRDGFREREQDDDDFRRQGGRFFNPGGDNKATNPLKPGVIIGPGGAGNAVPSNRKFGSWRGERWEGSRKADHWMEHFGGKQRLFSSQWYKDHPNAWKHHHDTTNVWVVATVPGIYSWLGWGAVPQQYAVGYGPAERFDASRYGEWYPLGVYSLMSGGENMGTRVVQLAVDRHGHIGGNYFDMITNDDKSLSGNVDRQSQRVEFWLNRNPHVRFRASIISLLQRPYGSITVRLPGGDQRWQFVRLEN